MPYMLQTSIDKMFNNPTFQPRWKPKQALPKAICSVDTCDETVYRNSNMASREQIENLVGKTFFHLLYSAINISTPLCQSHYMYVHNSLHARQPCTSCGSKPKRGVSDTVLRQKLLIVS